MCIAASRTRSSWSTRARRTPGVSPRTTPARSGSPTCTASSRKCDAADTRAFSGGCPAAGGRMAAAARSQRLAVGRLVGQRPAANSPAGRPTRVVERFGYEDKIGGSPRALFEDQDGNIWVGMRGGGLLRVSESVVQNDIPLDGLTTDGVRALSAAADGGVWVATEHNLHRFFGGARKVYSLPQTLALHTDKAGHRVGGDHAGRRAPRQRSSGAAGAASRAALGSGRVDHDRLARRAMAVPRRSGTVAVVRTAGSASSTTCLTSSRSRAASPTPIGATASGSASTRAASACTKTAGSASTTRKTVWSAAALSRSTKTGKAPSG